MRAGDLARERLMEEAPIVEPGQRVEVGELPRLAEAARVVDRRAGALGELLELRNADVVDVELASREDHGYPRPRRPASGRRDPSGSDRRGARLPRGCSGTTSRSPARGDRRAARDRLPVSLLLRQPERRDHRGRSRSRATRARRGSRSRRCGVERPAQHLVEVDRAAEIAQERVGGLLLGLLARAGGVPRRAGRCGR